ARHEPGGLVGNLICGEISRSSRQRGNYFLQQNVEPTSLQCGNRNDLLEVIKFAIFLDHRQKLRFVSQQVDLVQDEKGLGARLLQQVERKLVAGVKLARHVHDDQHKIASFERFTHFHHHLAAQGTIWLVYPWRIDQNYLPDTSTFGLGQMPHSLD